MKFLITFLLFINTHSVIAQEDCNSDVPNSLLSVISVTGKKCLTDMTSKDIQDLIVTKSEFKDFCKACKSEALTNTVTTGDGLEAVESNYGKSTLDEFQKELTFLTLDLMKMRSTYEIKFDPKGAIGSCNFKNLQKPKCITASQSEKYNKQIESIQKSLTTEIVNILSNSPDDNNGLIKRSSIKNKCNITDRDALFASTRYTETLITPEVIQSFKKLNLKSLKSIDALIKESSETAERKFEMASMKNHPIFQSLLSNKSSMSKFLGEISSKDSQQEIIEKLYSPKLSEEYGKVIQDRCDKLFSKTSQHLEEIYCSSTPAYIADDLTSIEGAIGAPFVSLKNDEAEEQIQFYCSQINNEKIKPKSFSEVSKHINDSNNGNLSKKPLYTFKSEVGSSTFNNNKDAICQAKSKNPECKKEDKSQDCMMLHFYNASKTDGAYQQMANASGDNINLILRSLIGTTVPEKDGKPDTQAIALLQSEGILPGADTTSRPQQQTAAAFHKSVSSQQAPSQAQAAKPAAVAPASPKTESDTQSSYAQSAAPTSDTPSEESSHPNSSDSPKSKSVSKSNTKFSNLSDDEQKRIMDMMKRSKKAGGKTPSSTENNEEEAPSESDFASANPSMSNIAAQAVNSASSVTSVGNKASAGTSAGKKAVLDPTKKVNSLNEAMVDANANRGTASSPSSSSTGSAQVSMSKTAANENEIKIKVADAELSQVNEFKEKLKVLLNAHSQEISVAGAGEKFVVKLNNFEINVVFNKATGSYEAVCKDASIPRDYLKTISTYFNVTLKGSSGKREALVNTLKQ